MLHVPVPIFWKDREGHLLGASRYWYGYFGLNPEGAAGEVNRMVPDDGTSGKEEEEILRTGKIRANVPCWVLSHSASHNGTMTRWPMYQSGQISGIMGYFFDEDMLSDGEDAARKSIEREPETGLNDVTHFLNSLGGLETEYAAVHRNFGILLIEIPEILRIQKRYGVSVQTEVPSGESWEALAWLQGLALRFSASCTATMPGRNCRPLQKGFRSALTPSTRWTASAVPSLPE